MDQRVGCCPQSCGRESSFTVRVSLALNYSVLQCSCSIFACHYTFKISHLVFCETAVIAVDLVLLKKKKKKEILKISG